MVQIIYPRREQVKKFLPHIVGTGLILLAIPVTVFLALNARQVNIPAASTDNPKLAAFQPVIFYAKDSIKPSTAELQAISNALDSIKYFYAQQTGETFEYLPPKIIQGSQTKNDYTNTDYFGCTYARMDCNIVSELIFLEKNTLNFFLTKNTGIGWQDKAPLIFTYDIFKENEARGLTQKISGYGGWAVMTDMILEGFMGDNGRCSDAGAANSIHFPQSQVACKITAHEIGHAFGLGHPCQPDLTGLMCSEKIRPPQHYPDLNVQLGPEDIEIVKQSPFSNPVEMNAPQFCFAGETVSTWCTGGNVFTIYRAVATSAEPPHYDIPADADFVPDCCRVEVNDKLITLGGFTIEVCGKGIDRNDSNQRAIGCQIKYEDMVQTYTKTLNLAPLDANGNPIHYDIYVDYKTISPQAGSNVPFKDRRIPWKEIKDQTALCYGITCPVEVSWAVPKFKSNLYKTGSTVSACSGYTNCDNYVTLNENSSNLKPKFTGLPPKLSVDMVVKIQAFENSGSTYEHFNITNFTTPTCSNRPSAPSAPTIGGGVLSGSAGQQSVTLNWSAPTSWGNECNYTDPREYVVALGTTNPPGAFTKVQTLSTVINNLIPGVTYYWRVAAQNKADSYGSYSSVGSFTTLPAPPTNSFKGKFFNNIDFTNFSFERTDPKILFSWGSSSPNSAIEADTFSAEWVGTFAFDGGTYRFNTQADDKLQVYLDGNLVISALETSKLVNKLLTPTAGIHEVRVNYTENSGSAFVKFNWVKPTCADFNADNYVNVIDLNLLSTHYGSNPVWDLNGDGRVNIIDLQRASQQNGQTCS